MPSEIDTLRQIVRTLIAEREFMSYQLSYAGGLIEEKAFHAIVEKHLGSYRDTPDNDLVEECAWLTNVLPADQLDSDIVSAALHIEADQADRVLESVRWANQV